MGLSQVELVMARRQVQAIINSDPEWVVFNRTTLVKQPDNSYKEGPSTPIAAQKVCFIPFKRRLTESIINSEFGEIPGQPYVLVGNYQLDVKRNDEFTWQGDKYVVQALDIKKQQHIVAQIDFKGGPNHE